MTPEEAIKALQLSVKKLQDDLKTCLDNAKPAVAPTPEEAIKALQDSVKKLQDDLKACQDKAKTPTAPMSTTPANPLTKVQDELNDAVSALKKAQDDVFNKANAAKSKADEQRRLADRITEQSLKILNQKKPATQQNSVLPNGPLSNPKGAPGNSNNSSGGYSIQINGNVSLRLLSDWFSFGAGKGAAPDESSQSNKYPAPNFPFDELATTSPLSIGAINLSKPVEAPWHVHTFTGAATFPFPGFDDHGIEKTSSGVTIYEGMKINLYENGNYELFFAVSIPDRPVTLRLQFQICPLGQQPYKITIPPIDLVPHNSNSVFDLDSQIPKDHRRMTFQVLQKGTSEASRQLIEKHLKASRAQFAQTTEFSRDGSSARFATSPINLFVR